MRILIATGGSGGHIFPALNVAQELKKEGHEVLFAGALEKSSDIIKNDGFDVFNLKAQGLTLNSMRSFFISTTSMLKAIKDSSSVLRAYKPEIVVGFGGYGAFPVVLVATLLRCPSMIHEQNVIPGRANRVLARLVDKVAISFKDTGKYFSPQKTVLTGCPCRKKTEQNKIENLRKFNLEENKFTILVLGGSQGSHRINDEFLKTIILLKPHLDFQVLHLTGPKDFEEVKEKYKKLPVKSCVLDFLMDMEAAYSIADLVISRAGAVTVTELATFRIPAILIPYPFAGAHQKENARQLCVTHLAQMIEENDLCPLQLKKAILEYSHKSFDSKVVDQDMSASFLQDGTLRVAREVLGLKR